MRENLTGSETDDSAVANLKVVVDLVNRKVVVDLVDRNVVVNRNVVDGNVVVDLVDRKIVHVVNKNVVVADGRGEGQYDLCRQLQVKEGVVDLVNRKVVVDLVDRNVVVDMNVVDGNVVVDLVNRKIVHVVNKNVVVADGRGEGQYDLCRQLQVKEGVGDGIEDRCWGMGPRDGMHLGSLEGEGRNAGRTTASVEVIDCWGAQSFDGGQNLDVRVLIIHGEADKRQKLRAS